MDKNERRILESIISNPGKLFSLDANSITSLETVLSGMQSNYDLTKKNGIIRKLTLSKSDFANLSEEEAERFVELGGDLK